MRIRSRLRNRRAWATVGAAALVGIAAWAGFAAYEARGPKRFGVVEEGRLYRSGMVTPAQLERLQREYGLRRVVSLLNPDAPEAIAEREAAARLGLRWENVALRGNGESTPADRRRILELLRNEAAGPTLVHYAAGTNRTGLAVGLYRLRCQGWPLERVLTELREYDFEDGPQHENLRRALAEEAKAAVAEAERAEAGPR